jgi:glycosyltransferase involved in cell wall biosynthesis
MSVGLPVIVTDDCGLAPAVARSGSGIVANPIVPALAAAARTLLADRPLARAMGERAQATARRDFGMRAIGDRLEQVYGDLVDGQR